MQKILIVGGSGYAGGYIADYFHEHGYDVSVFDNLTYESRFQKPIKFIYGDIRDYDFLRTIVQEYDIIIWMAALASDELSKINTELTISINQDSVKYLSHHYKGQIIFASTCSVYGSNDNVTNEESPLNPLSLYAETKIQAEQLILERKSNDLIFRFGTLFGIGDNYSRIRFDLIVNLFTLKAFKKEKLTVFGGDQWRPLLHVKDIPTAMHHCIQSNISGTFNLAYDNVKIKDVAANVSDIYSVPVEYVNTLFEDQRNYRVSCNKINQLGWVHQYNMKDGIKEIYEFLAQKRIWNLDNLIFSNSSLLRSKYGIEDC